MPRVFPSWIPGIGERGDVSWPGDMLCNIRAGGPGLLGVTSMRWVEGQFPSLPGYVLAGTERYWTSLEGVTDLASTRPISVMLKPFRWFIGTYINVGDDGYSDVGN